MEPRTYYLPIETSDGILQLKINHTVEKSDDDVISVMLSTTICDKSALYQAETTEEALILLAKNLPENWRIKSCLSCRYGHFCPVGNSDNELFCVTEFDPKEPSDLWHVTEDDDERKRRSHTLFECCENHQHQVEDYFTYSDYYYKMTKS